MSMAAQLEEAHRRQRAQELIRDGYMTREDFDEHWYPIPAIPAEQNPEAVAGKWTVKDSGKMAEYPSGMRRDTTEGKPKYRLMWPKGVPFEEQLIYRVAMHYTKGADKYSYPRLVEPAKLVNWCSCGNPTAILTGLTTLRVSAETAMNAIFANATRSLHSVSETTPPDGLSAIGPESAQQTWLTSLSVVNESAYSAEFAGTPASAWMLTQAKDFLLVRMASAQSAWTTLDQSLTWITTTIQDSHEVFFVHAVTTAWASLEIRRTFFGEHSGTCWLLRLQATSKGLSSGYGRNWEKSCTPEDLAHHEDALERHLHKFLEDVQDGEDHAAAVVWNINAVLLTRRNIRLADEAVDAVLTKALDDAIPLSTLNAMRERCEEHNAAHVCTVKSAEPLEYDQELPFQPPGQVQGDWVCDPTGRFWQRKGDTYHRLTHLGVPATWEEPRCPAHGNEKCAACSQNPDPSRCQCGYFEETGMHWDTCPGRIKSFPAHLPRNIQTGIHEIHGGDKDCWCGHKAV